MKKDRANQHASYGERLHVIRDLTQEITEILDAGARTEAEQALLDLRIAVDGLLRAVRTTPVEFEPYPERFKRRQHDVLELYKGFAIRNPLEWLRVEDAKAHLGWEDLSSNSFADAFRDVAISLELEHNGKKSRASAYRYTPPTDITDEIIEITQKVGRETDDTQNEVIRRVVEYVRFGTLEIDGIEELLLENADEVERTLRSLLSDPIVRKDFLAIKRLEIIAEDIGVLRKIKPLLPTQQTVDEDSDEEVVDFSIIQEDIKKSLEEESQSKEINRPELPRVSLSIGRQDWRDRAACLGLDPELFLPERGESTAEAKEVCRSCSVNVECDQYALAIGQKKGVWGNKTERQRRRINATKK